MANIFTSQHTGEIIDDQITYIINNKSKFITTDSGIYEHINQTLKEAKDYTDNEIATFDFIKIVDVLPEVGLVNRFYLVPKPDTQSQDLFDEYIWINKGTEEAPNWGWEWLTTKQIEVDLSGYITNADLENTIADLENTIADIDLKIQNTSSYAKQLQYYGDSNIVPSYPHKSDFNFIFNDDSEGYAISFAWDVDEDTSVTYNVVIPYEYKELPVTEIGSSESLDYLYRRIGKVIIPNTVTRIREYAFWDVKLLETINIPNSVTDIESKAFAYCVDLKSVVISSSVTHIKSRTFYYCNDLENITIPKSVTMIDDKAIVFPDGDVVYRTNVYYNGSPSEWAKISIGDDNEWLTNATIHFAVDDEPTQDSTKLITSGGVHGALGEQKSDIESDVIEAFKMLSRAPEIQSEAESDEDRLWWDMMTWDNGENRTSTNQMFRGFDFKNIGGFKPPYTIKLKGDCSYAFYGTKGITELKTEDIDFSGATSFSYSFQMGDGLTKVGTIDISNARGGITCLFARNSQLTEVEKVILGEDLAPLTYASEGSLFYNCTNLQKIAFEGTIADTLKFAFTKVLSKESIINVINILSDNAVDKTLELSLTAVNNAFGSSEATEWLDLVNTKPNWTITLS